MCTKFKFTFFGRSNRFKRHCKEYTFKKRLATVIESGRIKATYELRRPKANRKINHENKKNNQIDELGRPKENRKMNHENKKKSHR